VAWVTVRLINQGNWASLLLTRRPEETHFHLEGWAVVCLGHALTRLEQSCPQANGSRTTKLDASSGMRSGERARKCLKGVPEFAWCFTGCCSTAAPLADYSRVGRTGCARAWQNADQEPEELIIANPGAVDAMIQATVREVSTAARESGDTDGVWPMLHARSEAESIARLASDTPRRSQSLKAALLLPGSGHAAGMLALEGAEYATALPDVQNAERASARASEAAVAASAGDGQGGAEEEGMQLLATVGEKVALTAYQVATGAVAQSGAFDHLPEDYTGDDNAGKVPYMMTSWLLAMERAELDAKAALAQPPPEFPTREDEALEEWLQEKGGVMTSVAVAPIENKAGGMRGLVATAPLQEGTVILKVTLPRALSTDSPILQQLLGARLTHALV
jgi:hypothetical protein